jgi:acetylornithine deacetylase/succinyl-diaminopimelate desuccinylase-like protein
VVASGNPVVRLASGAGHDAAMLATIAPVAMLFVRCAGGVSHNPAESVTVEDVAAAIDATTRFFELVR